MSKKLFDVVKKSEDVRKIMEAIGSGIDPTSIQESLKDLGLDVEVDTIDWGNKFGTITIEGGENETGVILTLRLSMIEIGFDTLSVGHEEETREGI